MTALIPTIHVAIPKAFAPSMAELLGALEIAPKSSPTPGIAKSESLSSRVDFDCGAGFTWTLDRRVAGEAAAKREA